MGGQVCAINYPAVLEEMEHMREKATYEGRY